MQGSLSKMPSICVMLIFDRNNTPILMMFTGAMPHKMLQGTLLTQSACDGACRYTVEYTGRTNNKPVL